METSPQTPEKKNPLAALASPDAARAVLSWGTCLCVSYEAARVLTSVVWTGTAILDYAPFPAPLLLVLPVNVMALKTSWNIGRWVQGKAGKLIYRQKSPQSVPEALPPGAPLVIEPQNRADGLAWYSVAYNPAALAAPDSAANIQPVVIRKPSIFNKAGRVLRHKATVPVVALTLFAAEWIGVWNITGNSEKFKADLKPVAVETVKPPPAPEPDNSLIQTIWNGIKTIEQKAERVISKAGDVAASVAHLEPSNKIAERDYLFTAQVKVETFIPFLPINPSEKSREHLVYVTAYAAEASDLLRDPDPKRGWKENMKAAWAALTTGELPPNRDSAWDRTTNWLKGQMQRLQNLVH